MRYRVEIIGVPSYEGIAAAGDAARELPGRRVAHVLHTWPTRPDGTVEMRVLTEEADPFGELDLA